MREWCGCGAAIQSASYRRVLLWRAEHHCPARPEPPEPEKQGSFSSVERAPQFDHDSAQRIIGFGPTN